MHVMILQRVVELAEEGGRVRICASVRLLLLFWSVLCGGLGVTRALWPSAVESSIAVEAAVDYRSLLSHSCLFF